MTIFFSFIYHGHFIRPPISCSAGKIFRQRVYEKSVPDAKFRHRSNTFYGPEPFSYGRDPITFYQSKVTTTSPSTSEKAIFPSRASQPNAGKRSLSLNLRVFFNNLMDCAFFKFNAAQTVPAFVPITSTFITQLYFYALRRLMNFGKDIPKESY